jgi:hypothetical protein
MKSACERKTLILLCALNFFIGSNYWTALFISSDLPGLRSFAGLSYGSAEFLSSIASGFLLKKLKDT